MSIIDVTGQHHDSVSDTYHHPRHCPGPGQCTSALPYRVGRPGRGVLTVTVRPGDAGHAHVVVQDEQPGHTVVRRSMVLDGTPAARELLWAEADHALAGSGYYRTSRWGTDQAGTSTAAVEPLPVVPSPAWADAVAVLPLPGRDGGAVVSFEGVGGTLAAHDVAVWVTAELEAGAAPTLEPRVAVCAESDTLSAADARRLAGFLLAAAEVVERAGCAS
jgi:hypothetical protein